MHVDSKRRCEGGARRAFNLRLISVSGKRAGGPLKTDVNKEEFEGCVLDQA